MNKCGCAVKVIETVWLSVKRVDGTTGRREIGEVICCPKHGPIGDVRSTGSPKITAPAWDKMLRVHAWAPFYFVERDGDIVPEDYVATKPRPKHPTQPAELQQMIRTAPQDLAANDDTREYENEEFEPF